ncbi:MAG: hypothetical protein CM15mP21_3730 [Hyphomicrobiales bacterium]|nr:MAG: hypothetical protein CM15mP21_3730 [Hyphomicrobiales bacterium]
MDAQIFEREDAAAYLEKVNGILVPGGFGERGAEGKIAAAHFARTRNVPYFGICFGMQMAVLEAARHLASRMPPRRSSGWPGKPGVGLIPNGPRGSGKTRHPSDLGGTMRLGAYEAFWQKIRVWPIFMARVISERHRHRYEVEHGVPREFGKNRVGVSGRQTAYCPKFEILNTRGSSGAVSSRIEIGPFAPHPFLLHFLGSGLAQARLV